MLVHVEAPFRHVVLGETRDDAAGEAFDKVAKMLGLGYPGGPAIDRLGAEGNPAAVRFPRSFLEEGTLDFSFSGIKTSVLYYLRREGLGESGAASTLLNRKQMADICASFQAAIVDVLVARTMSAALRLGLKDIALAGGVSANSSLRRTLRDIAGKRGCSVFTPRNEYCMDNGAMIAYVGWMRFLRGLTSAYETPAVAYLEMTGKAS
jgi:N6-L-threonylcarbamoyladenine synthase